MAHDKTLHHQFELAGGDSHDDGGEAREGVLDAANIGHHHCPMAPACDNALTSSAYFYDRALLFAAAVSPLESLSQPPPLEPPAA